ncbi:hypothetical protein NM208_g4903 [Fusarium decemcellulare]|uniref:Uncharacterized protein n=1 Tax=Fusarium decemcellulare TaxID=57161 RepID=A0ACC1SIZ0_9HYPO|nr:hypothetical protein NM208_g4903 [Fusarium decemcellulare]
MSLLANADDDDIVRAFTRARRKHRRAKAKAAKQAKASKDDNEPEPAPPKSPKPCLKPEGSTKSPQKRKVSFDLPQNETKEDLATPFPSISSPATPTSAKTYAHASPTGFPSTDCSTATKPGVTTPPTETLPAKSTRTHTTPPKALGSIQGMAQHVVSLIIDAFKQVMSVVKFIWAAVCFAVPVFVIRWIVKSIMHEQELHNARALKTAADRDLAKLQGKKDELDESQRRGNRFVANLDSSMQRLLGNDTQGDSGIELGDEINTDDVLLGVIKTAAQSYIDFAKKHGAAIVGDEPKKLTSEISEVKKRIYQADEGIKKALHRQKTLMEMTKAKDTQDRVREAKRRREEIEREVENAEKAAQECSVSAETKEAWTFILER